MSSFCELIVFGVLNSCMQFSLALLERKWEIIGCGLGNFVKKENYEQISRLLFLWGEILKLTKKILRSQLFQNQFLQCTSGGCSTLFGQHLVTDLKNRPGILLNFIHDQTTATGGKIRPEPGVPTLAMSRRRMKLWKLSENLGFDENPVILENSPVPI